MRVTWVQPEDLIRHELWQATAEGRDVSDLRERWVQAGGAADPPYGGASPEVASSELRRLAVDLLDEADRRSSDDELDGHGSAVDEPSDTLGIVTVSARTTQPVDTERLADRITAGWLGRSVGCVLGKPVEKIPRAGIQAILESTGRWPLDRYFTAVGLADDVAAAYPWNRASRPTSLEENISGMPEDDDLNYTLMALRTVEQHGRDFSPDDVAQGWLLDLPAGRAFTAERVAYRNLLDGLSPPDTARRHNPFREWIGAQIRTDLYGWISPGDGGTAADLAYRDASVSHTRNGLYGAMFVAAMTSAAVGGAFAGVDSPVDAVLDAGLAVVPPRSRFAAAVAFGRELAAAHPAGTDPRPAYAELERRFAGMHWVHVLNNAALLSYALAAGRGDFDATITLTVMGGWDTDSNGATAGSVVGSLVGTEGIDDRWTAPLHDRLATSIPGCDGSSFADLARRTLALVDTPDVGA